MRKLIVLVMLVPALALAQPGSGSGSASPGSGSAVEPAPTPPAPPPPAAPNVADLRKTCVEAMNADKSFADSIVKVADENAQIKRDADTLKAHQDAADHVAKNEKHVIYAYSAMWLIAAAFLIFLWMRQQRLTVEIVQLRRDLAAAAKPTDPVEPVKPK